MVCTAYSCLGGVKVYSGIFYNGHLSTTVTLFIPADSPDILSHFHLSTTAKAIKERRNCQNNQQLTKGVQKTPCSIVKGKTKLDPLSSVVCLRSCLVSDLLCHVLTC